MVPLHMEQPPPPGPPITLSVYIVLSQYARVLAAVVTFVVGLVVLVLFLRRPPSPKPDFHISLDKLTVLNLTAHPIPTNLSVEYNFFVQMSAVRRIGIKFKFEFSNLNVRVLMDDGELEIRTEKYSLPPFQLQNPIYGTWTFELYGTKVGHMDVKRVQHLTNLIKSNESILITIMVSGKDYRRRDFTAKCPAHIHSSGYPPAVIDACGAIIFT